MRRRVGLRFIAQRTVCASIVARVVFDEGASLAFKHKP